MLKRIRCTNFRGFHDFDTPLDAISVFLGPNSSGKTTALHAVRLGCEALHLALNADTPARVEDNQLWIEVTKGTLVNSAQLLPLMDWRALFVDQVVGEGVSLTLDLTFEETDPVQEIHIRIDCARNAQLKLTVRARASAVVTSVGVLPKRSVLINQRLRQFLLEHAPVAVFVPPFYGTVRDEEYRSRAVIDQLLGSGDQSHAVRNLVVDLSVEQFDRLNAFLADTIGARITTRTSQNDIPRVTHLKVEFRDNNGDIELSAAGAGLINLVALFTALSRWRLESIQRRVIFLLDEPEAHLHPRLQAESAERLGRLVTREFAAQLILATHSVDILNRLSTRGARLIRCDRKANPSAVTLESDAHLFDDLAEWVEMAPYTAINFLASRRVVFCEGKSELTVLPRLAELRFRNNPTHAERFRRWAFVPLNSASNAPIAPLLAKLVRNDVVRARAGGEAFKVVVILDRDHHREPGTHEEQAGGVFEATTVWSQHSLESLLIEPGILALWIQAMVGETHVDLINQIAAAHLAANADQTLNEMAMDQLAAKLATGELFNANGQRLGGEQKLIHASRRAREMVREAPAVWQRGKDRARFVLQRVREIIPLPQRNHFTTDIIKLVSQAELNRIGDPSNAIPIEIGMLLDRLVLP